ncbi:MAG: nucleotidyltransferase domain-containing protein [Negativicutes bacterium]|jgi:predicted nucleotidyltransferase
MLQERIAEIAEYIRRQLEESGVRVGKLILFGSAVRNSMNEDSDLDFAVVSVSFGNVGSESRALLKKHALMGAIHKYQIPIDLFTLTPEEYEQRTQTIAHYIAEGKELYAA